MAKTQVLHAGGGGGEGDGRLQSSFGGCVYYLIILYHIVVL